MKKIFFVLFVLISCLKEPEKVSPDILKFINHWQWSHFSTFELEDKFPYLEKDEKNIPGPPGTWITLWRARTLFNLNQELDHCLLYKTPHFKGADSGELKLIQISQRTKCADYYFSPGVSITGINYFSLKIFPYSADRKNISWKITHQLKNYEGSLSMPNLGPSYKRGAYASGVNQRSFEGVIFLHPKKMVKENVEIKTILPIGNLDDDWENGNAKICHKVDSKCQTIGKYECDRCRYGWYEVIDSNCAKGGSKFCGVDRCGERGYPACHRGRFYTGVPSTDYCAEPWVGFCQDGLRPYCQSGVLVCL